MIVILKLLFLITAIKTNSKVNFTISPDMTADEKFDIFLRKATYLIEETGKKINKCLKKRFESDLHGSIRLIKIECAGQFNEIINRVYRANVDILHIAFLDVLNQDLDPFKEELKNEIDFLYENLKMMIDKDFQIKETLYHIKFGVRYHVDPKKFENLCKILDEKINYFEEEYTILKEMRISIKKTTEAMIKKREENITKLLLKVKKFKH